jgi:hypothetical protein
MQDIGIHTTSDALEVLMLHVHRTTSLRPRGGYWKPGGRWELGLTRGIQELSSRSSLKLSTEKT